MPVPGSGSYDLSPFGDPSTYEVLHLSTRFSLTPGLLEWETRLSDIAGCASVSEAELVKAGDDFEDPQYPAFALLDLLRKRDFKSFTSHVMVNKTTRRPREFYLEDPVAQNMYFKVLLRLRHLPRAPAMLPSDNPQSYYRCLLAGIDAAPDMRDKAYLRLMNDDPMVTLPAPAPPLALPPPDGAPATDTDTEIEETSDYDVARDHPMPEDGTAPDSSSTSSSSSQATGISTSLETHDTPTPPVPVPPAIEGAALEVHIWRGKYVRVRATRPLHGDACRERRG